MMKNGLFFTILLLLAASAFAQDMRNQYLFIEGSASRADHFDYFHRSFVMEAGGSGYIVTNSQTEATHTLRFNVTASADPYAYEYGYEYEPVEQYVITMSLYRNADNFQLITFDFTFNSLEEMYPFARTLFLNSVTSIPLPILTEDYIGKQWDKWIYFRMSFDWPITFYVLQPTGLKGGSGLYNIEPARVSSIDHEFTALPGATVGVEFQFFNFLTLELNFQLNMGDTRDNYFINMGTGAELKVPVKFRNLMMVPYGAFVYSLHDLRPSPVFSEFPPFSVGGGLQFCARAGKRGILFVDAKYLFSFTDVVMHNPYLAFTDKMKQLYPEPAVIHYKRSVLGIGIGYKIGIIDRPKKDAHIKFRL